MNDKLQALRNQIIDELNASVPVMDDFDGGYESALEKVITLIDDLTDTK